jgi:DNA invertase Pin-like site-specific DNA recombinase
MEQFPQGFRPVALMNFERAGLTELLNYARSGDVLCVMRLDRLCQYPFNYRDTCELNIRLVMFG